MPFKVTRRKDGGVLCEFLGVVTPGENEAAHKEVEGGNPQNFKKIPYLIVDHTGTEHFNHSSEEIQKRAVLANERLATFPNLYIAIVTPGDLFFGVARMWQTHSRMEDRVKLFRSLDEAEIWVHQKAKKN